jgi:hypothetical protein
MNVFLNMGDGLLALENSNNLGHAVMPPTLILQCHSRVDGKEAWGKDCSEA